MAVVDDITGKVWLALRAKLEQFDECAIEWPMEPTGEAPDAKMPYLYVEPVALDYEVDVLPYQCGEENRGFLNIRVNTPFTWNYAAAAGLMGRVKSAMPAGWQGFYDDARVLIYRKPTVQGAPFIDGGHNRQDLRVDWRAWG